MPKIDTTKIEGYEAMSAEDKLAALEAFEYEDHSAEVATLKNSVSKSNSEAAEWKRKHHALLDEDERKSAEAAERAAATEAELAEAKKTIAVTGYVAQLLKNGYSAELAQSTAEAMASGDTEKVFANQQAFLAEHDKALKADLLKQTPKPQVSNGGADTSIDDLAKKAQEAIDNGDIAQASKYYRMIAELNAAAKN